MRAALVDRVPHWVFVAVATVLFPSAALAATTGNNGTHDPSRIIESNGRFYFCSTGGRCASSADGLAWTTTGLHITVPAWSTQYEPNGNQGIWAPDIINYNGTYYIYYAVAGLPAKNAPCLIGLYTTPTLDSTAPSFKLTDAGMVVNNPPNTSAIQFSTIDPGPLFDAAGNLWSVWGGGYPFGTTANSIFVTRLANSTGLPVTTDPGFKPPGQPGYPVAQGHREGAYVYYHQGSYFLFWQTGSCCSGASSTYKINVSRATSMTGPYSGDRVFYAGGSGIHGPGHIGIYDACGASRFTYHYYPDTGGSVLGENELTWGSDGFPVAGAASTTPLKPCGQNGSNGSSETGGGSGTGGSGAAGGTSGTGGIAGTGGETGMGGAAGTGGPAGTGGNDATGGASGGAGGMIGTGGAANGMSGGLAGGDGGCSCDVHPGNPQDHAPLYFVLFALAMIKRSLRRR